MGCEEFHYFTLDLCPGVGLTCSSRTHAEIMQSSSFDEQVSLHLFELADVQSILTFVILFSIFILNQVAGRALGVDPQRGMRRAFGKAVSMHQCSRHLKTMSA